MEVGVWLPGIIGDMCMQITECQSGVMVGTSPAYRQCPHNPVLLQVRKVVAWGGGPVQELWLKESQEGTHPSPPQTSTVGLCRSNVRLRVSPEECLQLGEGFSWE